MKWQYKTVTLESAFKESPEEMLNGLGADGWELVSVVDRSGLSYATGVKPASLLILKRPCQEQDA